VSLALIIFWGSVALVAYAYVLYPAAIGLLARVRPRRRRETHPIPCSVSFVMAARQEGLRVYEKAVELTAQLDRAGVDGEVIVVLDGPGLPGDVLQWLRDEPRVQLIERPQPQGKAAALAEGARHARREILALCDVRQTWQDDALERLLERFCDPRVGAVSGDLVLLDNRGMIAGVGLYWRYEKWLRAAESRFDSVVGLTGAICTVRRELFHAPPPGTILDDVYWPMRVVMAGYCVEHDRRAVAHDRLPDHPRDEFHRKVRTLAGNFQLVALLPGLLLPWRNRLWWQLISHKLLRLAVPWALLAALIASALIVHPVYRVVFAMQTILYGLTALGILTGFAGRHRLTAAAASFVLLNAAAWTAFWVWASGRAARSWGSANYRDTVPTPAKRPSDCAVG